MQLTLSLNRRTHLFVRDGKLFFKLYKQSKFTDKKDLRCSVTCQIKGATVTASNEQNAVIKFRRDYGDFCIIDIEEK